MDPDIDPIVRFQRALENAEKTAAIEPRCSVLATVDERGRPSARVIVLQSVAESGFVFVTDRDSRKGHHMARIPYAALCLYWVEMCEQARVEGPVEIVSDEDSDRYWALRSRNRQLASWASHQSAPLQDPRVLEQRMREYHQQFDFGPVPRPARWVGYRVIPQRIEFWRSGGHRLHEVTCYERTDAGWQVILLNP